MAQAQRSPSPGTSRSPRRASLLLTARDHALKEPLHWGANKLGEDRPQGTAREDFIGPVEAKVHSAELTIEAGQVTIGCCLGRGFSHVGGRPCHCSRTRDHAVAVWVSYSSHSLTQTGKCSPLSRSCPGLRAGKAGFVVRHNARADASSNARAPDRTPGHMLVVSACVARCAALHGGFGWQKVTNGIWHELRVDVRGNTFVAFLDGNQVVDVTDDRYNSGGIGLWTKSDSVTCFDDVELTGS